MIRHGAKDLEIGVQVVPECHDTRHVTTPITVVRRAPDGHDVVRGEVVLVPFINELMSAGDELEIVNVIELGAN